MLSAQYDRPVFIGRMSGTQLREMRQAYGMTQQYLANKLNIHPVTLAQWEGGRYAVPPYLYRVVPPIGYQAILMRNQAIIDQYRFQYQVGYDAYCELGKRLDVKYDLTIFDAFGRRIGWQKINRDGYFAIGETDGGRLEDGGWVGFAIPQDADPKPELELPSPAEMGYFFDERDIRSSDWQSVKASSSVGNAMPEKPSEPKPEPKPPTPPPKPEPVNTEPVSGMKPTKPSDTSDFSKGPPRPKREP